jgi:hypothetical protein
MSSAAATSTQDSKSFGFTLDIKSVLNSCKPNTPYTKIVDLREDSPYNVLRFERVTTPYGETVMVVLEGHEGEDHYLRVYLPRRFNEVLSDHLINSYNFGPHDIIRLIKRSTVPGSKITPLEFI